MRLFIILASLPILAQQIPPSPPAVNSSSVPQVAGLKVVAITQPSAPTVTPTCTGTCATSYSYVVEAYTQFGSLHTQGSIAGSTSAQAATLDSTHFNQVATVVVTNSAYCKVFRSVGGATQGVIATVACGGSIRDTGLSGDSSIADTSNTTGNVSILGTVAAANIGIDPSAPPYNAVGNGTADDSAAIQTAITAAATAQVPLIIRKIYAASGLNLPSNTTVYGYPGGALKHNGAGSTSLLSAAASAVNIRLYDLELIGVATDATTQTVGFNSAAAGVSNIKIARCNIHNFNQNVALVGYGAGNPTVTDVEIFSSQIHDAIGTTAGYGYGVIATGAGVSNVRVHDNVLVSNQRHAIYFANGLSNSFANQNEVYHAFSGSNAALVVWSPTVGYPTTFVALARNRIYSPYLTGIEVNDGAGHITISDNEIYDPQTTQCIIIEGTQPGVLDPIQWVTVKSNYCRTGQTGTPSVVVQDALDVLVQANTIEGTAAITAFEVSDSASNSSRRVTFRDNNAIGVIGVGYRVNSNGAHPLLANNRALPTTEEVYDGSGGTGTPVFEDTARSCTIASLPVTPMPGKLCRFTDASTTSDCTVGSGSAKSLCMWNGSIWAKP